MAVQGANLMAEMLRLMNQGGVLGMDRLAQQLGVSEAMATAMAETLTAQGYLAPVGEQCSTACGSCSLAGACGQGTGLFKARMLALTAKGKRGSRQ